MGNIQGSAVLKEIEQAIEKRNFGRMNEIGNNIIVLAKDDPAWIEAVVVITGYMTKNENHLWDALHLSKQAAVMAPENTDIQTQAVKAMTDSIKSFPKVEDRVKAAHSVVVYAPKGSSVLVISINLMLDNVLGLPQARDRKRYTMVALQYAPENSAVRLKAKTYLHREQVLMAKTANANTSAPVKADAKKPLLSELEQGKLQNRQLPAKKGTGPQMITEELISKVSRGEDTD